MIRNLRFGVGVCWAFVLREFSSGAELAMYFNFRCCSWWWLRLQEYWHLCYKPKRASWLRPPSASLCFSLTCSCPKSERRGTRSSTVSGIISLSSRSRSIGLGPGGLVCLFPFVGHRTDCVLRGSRCGSLPFSSLSLRNQDSLRNSEN